MFHKTIQGNAIFDPVGEILPNLQKRMKITGVDGLHQIITDLALVNRDQRHLAVSIRSVTLLR